MNLAYRIFNADDRAAQLNAGSYAGIPFSARAAVNHEFKEFVHANIFGGTFFALEDDSAKQYYVPCNSPAAVSRKSTPKLRVRTASGSS